MMIPYQHKHALWEVLWLVRQNGKPPRIIAVDCDDELFEAMRVYTKAVKAGKPMVTLRCKNMGFPVPFRYAGKMKTYNDAGIIWCPYCNTLRRFEKRAGYESEATGEWVNHVHYACPMCDITHENGLVIKYNPLYTTMAHRRGRRRGRSKKKRSRNKRK